MRAIALAAVLMMFGAGQALAYDDAVEDFVGSWENVDRVSASVIRLEIRPYRHNRVSVAAVGRCGRHECQLGTAQGQLFRSDSDNAGEDDTGAILVRFDRGDLAGNVLLRLNRRGTMVSHALLTFRESGERIYRVEQFEQTRGDTSDERLNRRRRVRSGAR